MKNYELLKILLWLVVCQANSFPSSKKRSENIEKFYLRTGEDSVDNLIQKYEKEHQQFYEQGFKNGNNLKWPDLKNKNLSIYCRKYLQKFIPSRSNENSIGLKIKRRLHYETNNTSSIMGSVVIVQCKVMNKFYQRSYYITRAPEPNCVYTLKYKSRIKAIFTITNKYCDFEDKPILNRSLKRKRVAYINNTHQKKGQPIAKDGYLIQYEFEHQELLKQEGEDGIFIRWSYVMDHSNLDSYCSQYIEACSLRKNLRNVAGSWNVEKLHYQKVKTNKDIDVITVTCLLTNLSKRFYIITRAPEKNCVYALLRLGRSILNPFIITSKHCHFEHQSNQKTSSHDYANLDNYIFPKNEIKEENFYTLETHKFFPQN